MNVLLVEDDDSIAGPLATGLARDGFDVTRVATGADALAAPGTEFVLLDLGLPDIDGTDVCRQLRARSDVPIIVLTARADEIDRVVLLELGADDYVVKPFGFRELVARMRAVARRTHARGERSEPDAAAQVGALTIGLAIVAQLAAASGGDATLLPGPNGAGTDARVRFAVARRGPS
jgi:DNA-binding response OmpR family regulator